MIGGSIFIGISEKSSILVYMLHHGIAYLRHALGSRNVDLSASTVIRTEATFVVYADGNTKLFMKPSIGVNFSGRPISTVDREVDLTTVMGRLGAGHDPDTVFSQRKWRGYQFFS